MAFLVDTNCLLRWARRMDPQHAVAMAAVMELIRRGEQVYVTPQNLIEFWNVATRPLNKNGFGMTPAQADHELTQLQNVFRMAPDTDAIFPAWRNLVRSVGVSGVQVHDARLVAVMQVHGLTHILTFNTQDFVRYAGITVVHPQSV